MDIEKAISLENLSQYKKNTSEKIKSYVDTKTSVIQDGTKTVGGVSVDDYNAFKSAVEDSHIHSNKSVLDEIDESVVKGGKLLFGSTGYSVNDSVEYPIVGLKLFGNSEQKQYLGKNLLNLQSAKLFGGNTPEFITNGFRTNATSNADRVVFCNCNLIAGQTYHISFKCTVENASTSVAIYVTGGGGDQYISGTSTTFVAQYNSTKMGFYIDLSHCGENVYFTVTNPQLELGSTATSYEPYVGGIPSPNPDYPQEITSVVEPTVTVNNDTNNVSLPLQYTLNAIPVSTGGNVTIDGKKYIADYVDFERGVKVQRVEAVKLSANNFLQFDVNKKRVSHSINQHIVEGNSVNYTMCNCLIPSYAAWSYESGSTYFIYNTMIYMWTQNFGIETEEDWKTFIANNDIIVYHALATPIETLLSETELQAYRQLQTYNGVTNISNDKGAGIEVNYCTSKMLAEYTLPLIKDLEAENAKKDEEISVLKTDILTNEKIHNRIYEGISLAEKFASEIAASPYNGDVWAWIKARITAENFTGIRVGDYIPFTTTNGIALNAQIAGINTYKNYGDTPVGAHIDFICKELWGTLHPINKVNYNNGTTNQNHPWLASDLYLYLNSLSGSVPNETAVNPVTVDVDYTTGGVYYYLPEALKNVIIEKRFLLPKRYSASGLITDDNHWSRTNIGKLWLPDECEVYGAPIWGGKGFSAGGSGLQYPLFAGNMNRLKLRNGSRDSWWLLSPYSGNFSSWCRVDANGGCNSFVTSYGYAAAPVCFRV